MKKFLRFLEEFIDWLEDALPLIFVLTMIYLLLTQT